MSYNVAVVGATGNVGREMLNILEEREFPVNEIFAIASRRSIGIEVSFGDKTLKCQDLATFDFSKCDFALMSAGGDVSKEWSPKIGKTGLRRHRQFVAPGAYDIDVPLIVPEVNPDAVAGFRKKNIIANPNCSTAQLVVALKPLHDAATIKRVVVATYQSVSGAGKEAMDELWNQTKGIFVTGHTDAGEVHQADRLQRHSAHRQLHGRRLHRRRMEDGGRDPEDPRSEDQADGDMRARAGVRRPFGGGEHRVREADLDEERPATSCVKRPDCSSSISARTAATSRRSSARASSRSSSAASARIRPSRTA